MIDCTFTNNIARSGAALGGAIYHFGNIGSLPERGGTTGNSLSIVNSVFMNNSAGIAGAVYVRNAYGFTIIDSTFIENKVTVNGGAIISYLNNNSFVINSTFINNSAVNVGGAIHNSESNLTVINSIFNDNAANNDNGSNESRGGAISNYGVTTNIIIDNCIFNNNSAGQDGGAIYNYLGNLTVNNSIITNNSAENDNGGGIYNSGNATIENNTINDNLGGGISNTGDAIISNNEISGNTYHGIKNNGAAIIEGNNITDNDGIGIINTGNATLNDNIITGNADISFINNGTLTGSGNTIDYRTNLTIVSATVSYNKVTIMVKAIDDQGDFIVGATINFYVNGKLVGSAVTNNVGIAQFTYTAASSGLQSIVASMPEFNTTNSLASVVAIHLAANKSTSVNVVLENATIITINAPNINEGKKTNIKVTFKDINGNILKNKKISLTINGKTYTTNTNDKGIAVFKIAGLKGGKHTLTAKFAGDNNYKPSTTTKVQKINPKTDLAIVSIKKVKSSNKQNPKYKVTIINKGSLKSKPTTLSIFHIRKGIKIKAKNFKVKSIAPGKKISIIVDYYPDRPNHRHCIAYYTLDPKNKNKELILANNKKSISLKH